MRKIIIAAVAVLLLIGAAGGWWAYRHLFRDPLEVARELTAKGQLQAASLELRNAIKRHPDNAVAHARLGALQLALGDAVAAERELKAGRAGGYQGTEITPLLARAMLAQGRTRDVLAEGVPDGLPPADAAGVLVARGLAQLSLNDAAAAAASAEAAERLSPGFADATLLGARIAAGQGQSGRALQLLDEALQHKPALMEALLMKASILTSEGEPAAALPVLDTAVAAAPNATAPRLARAGVLLARGDDATAEADIDAVLKHEPRNPRAGYFKTVLRVRARDWKGADAALQVIQPLLPRLPRGEYYFALVKTNLNQAEQAADAIGRYTARAPGDADGWRLLARIDLQAGRKEDAAAALARLDDAADTQAADRQAEGGTDAVATPQTLTRLASVQLGAGDAGAARQDLERSLETVPQPADTAAAEVRAALRAGDIGRAAARIEKLQRQPKADPEQVAALTGAVRLAQLDLAGARAAFETGLQVVPRSVLLKVDLARVLALQDHLAEAEALLIPVLQMPQKEGTQKVNPVVLGTLIDLFTAAGQPERAMDALKAARAAQPDDAALLVAQATLQARGGDAAGALAMLDAAPSVVAHNPRLLETRIRFLVAAGKPREAADLARQLLQDAGNAGAPGSLAVRRQLIELLLASGQGEAAVQAAREGLQAAPGNSAMLQAYVGATFRASGLDATLALVGQLRHDPVNLPISRLLKGAVYLAANRPADAAAAYAAESAEAPFSALVVAEATALRAAGHTDEARAKLVAWTAKQPDPAASDALGAFDIEAKQLDEAEHALNDVLAARPSDAVALNNLAWVYQQKHDPKALPLARKAYLLAPGGQTADTLGWILTGQGQPETGLLLLRQAAAQLPRDPAVHYHLAVALNDTGHPDQAGALLAAILAQPVKFDEKDEARRLQEKLAVVSPGK